MRSSKAPELPVILLEDFGALIGLAFALLGVGLMLITGNPIVDVLGSGSIGVLLVLIAAFLAVEMKLVRYLEPDIDHGSAHEPAERPQPREPSGH